MCHFIAGFCYFALSRKIIKETIFSKKKKFKCKIPKISLSINKIP